MKIKHLLAAAALGLCALAAFALPSVEQVQSEVRQGHYVQAESMMQEVVAARPDSARAHYLYAEILAHNGRFDQASQEAARARQIDPNTSFTDPAKFAAFEQLLQREQAHASRSLSLGTPALPAVQAPAPASSAMRMHGTLARMRVSSVISAASFCGTFRSARMKTRWPASLPCAIRSLRRSTFMLRLLGRAMEVKAAGF